MLLGGFPFYTVLSEKTSLLQHYVNMSEPAGI